MQTARWLDLELDRRARRKPRAMRSLLRISSIVLLALSIGACATIVDVDESNRDEIAGLHYWNWLPSATDHVNAEHRDTFELEILMAEHLKNALEARGYRRDAKLAGFYVDYALVLDRRFETRKVSDGSRYVASNNSSASYIVEGTRPVQRLREDSYLVLRLWSLDGRQIWQGTLRHSQDLAGLPDLSAHATDLVARLPKPVEVVHGRPGEAAFASAEP